MINLRERRALLSYVGQRNRPLIARPECTGLMWFAAADTKDFSVRLLEHQADQGNRVKKSTPNETCQVIVIPSGDLAADAQGIFVAGRF